MKPAVWIRRLPWSIVAIAAGLLIVGCMGIDRFELLSEGGGGFLRRQLVFAGLGLATLLVTSAANYRLLYRWSYALFALSLILLAAVYFFPEKNGAHRWIPLGPVSLQPSEFAKVAFVLVLARYLMYRHSHRRLLGLAAPLAIAFVPVMLILREPDLGTALVFVPVLFVMLLAAGARRGDLAWVVVAGLLMLPLLWTQMSREQKSRVTALLEQPAADARPSDDAYHLHQAKRMFALGGTWGSLVTGRTSDDPAVYRLPEAQSDFIFCVLGERFGLPGLAVVLGLYGILAWRGLVVAAATREPFGRLAAAGIVGLFAVEVLINTGMTVGLLPITGLSLPLISHGGSGLLAHSIALGLLVNIGLRPGYEVSNEPFRYVVE